MTCGDSHSHVGRNAPQSGSADSDLLAHEHEFGWVWRCLCTVSPKSSRHDIWGMTNTTDMAALSLAVVALFAVGVLTLSVRVFTRAAIH